MTEEERLAKEYNERKLKEELERYEAQNQEAYDKEVSGENFLKDRAKEENDDPNAGDIAKGVGFEIAAGVATDIATKPLLALPPVYALANFVSGAAANAIAQRLRGDTSFSLGEILSSGAVGVIPGTSLKAGKNLSKVVGKANTIKRAAISGGLSGVGSEALRIGIDEQRFLNAKEALLGGAVGGTASAGMKKLLDAGTTGLQNYAQQLKPIEVYAMSPKKPRPPSFSTTGTFGRARYYESPQQTQKIASELINTWGMRDLTFDFDKYEIMRPKVVNSASRLFGELFESVPYTKINFNTMQQAKVPALQKKYSSIVTALGFPARKFQLHHTVPVKGSLPGYDGLAFGSNEWWEVTEILFRNMLRPGNDAFNLTALVGGNKPTTVLQNGIPTRFPTPHSVTHKFLDAKIGPSGEKFWTKEVRKKMKLDFEYRKEKWQEYAELVKQSQDITNQAEFTFRDLYEDIPEDQLNDELDLLIDRLVDLDDRGLLNKTSVGDDYQVPQMRDIVTEVAEEMRASDLDAALDTVTGRQQKQREFVRKRLIEEIELRKLNDMTVSEQMAKLQEMTGMSIDDIQLLIQTQPGFDIAKFIFDNQ